MIQITPFSKAKITALGSYIPEKILTNFDLEKIVETSDEWIIQRTGMKERRIASATEFTSHLCIKAIQNMIETSDVIIEDVDMILVATTTPDFPFPAVACQIQEYFSIPRCGALDLSAACAGFVYGLNFANALITSGQCKKVLVLGGETLSKVTDYNDRTTCILFGDGAGAALVEYEEEEPSFLLSEYGSYGKAGIHLYRTGLSTQMGDKKLEGDGKIVQNGREIFKLAVSTLSKALPSFLDKAGVSLEAVDWFVPHSANLRMIDSICERLHFPKEKVLFSAEFYGNTSSATIPLALCDGLRNGQLKKGDYVLLSGFGGGFVYSNTLLQWRC